MLMRPKTLQIIKSDRATLHFVELSNSSQIIQNDQATQIESTVKESR